MRLHTALLLGVWLLMFSAVSGRAQTADNSAKTAKIGTLTATGNHKIPSDQIVAATGFKPGDVVSAQQIQAAADRLAALGLFSAVNYRFSSKGDAIALEFQVQEGTTVPVLFDNFPWFTDEELVSAIRAKVGLFAGEAPESGAMIDEITEVLANLLASRKIPGTVVHQLIAPPFGDDMIMQFRIDNSELTIRSVKFGDSLASDSERLKDRVGDIADHPYSRFAIDLFEGEQIRPLYTSKGFIRAQIGPPQSQLAGNSGATAVDVAIPIKPGPAYVWKGVTWQGNLAIQTSVLDAMVTLKPGEVANGMDIENLWRKIESAYKDNGYLDLKLNVEPQFDDTAHQISYRVSVFEGPQYRMGEMVITGLSTEAENAIRHAWKLLPAQIFDNDYADIFVNVLSKPDPVIFGDMPVHYTECGHWLRPDPNRHLVDVLLDFK
jgi:outer membrane protein insertion porin family